MAKDAKSQNVLDVVLAKAELVKGQNKLEMQAAFDMVVIQGLSYKDTAARLGVNYNTLRYWAQRQKWSYHRRQYQQASVLAQREYNLALEAKEQAEKLLDAIQRCTSRIRMMENLVSNELTLLFVKAPTESITTDKGVTQQVKSLGPSGPGKLKELLGLNSEIIKQLKELGEVNQASIRSKIARATEYIETLEPRLRNVTANYFKLNLPDMPVKGTTKNPALPKPLKVDA